MPEQTTLLTPTTRLSGHFQWPLQTVQEEKQKCNEHLFPSRSSPWPVPSSPEPPTNRKGRPEASTPSSKQSAQLQPWTPAQTALPRPLPRLSPEEISPTDHRGRSMTSGTPTPPGFLQIIQEFSKRSRVIQNNREFSATPRQSKSFRLLQEAMEAKEREVVVRFRGRRSLGRPFARPSQAGMQKDHTCDRCGTRILTQALQLTGSQFRHPSCFNCADCDLNLQLHSHFWVGDDVFCQTHAQERGRRRASTHLPFPFPPQC